MAGEPLLTGQNVPITIFVDGKPFGKDVGKNVRVHQVATQFRDSHLGKKRDSVDIQVDGYDVEVDLDVATSTLLDALLKAQAARDARKPIPPIAVQMTLEQRDGQDKPYLFTPCTAMFDLEAARKDRAKQSLKIQAEDMLPQAA